jgi:hypothetical protein
MVRASKKIHGPSILGVVVSTRKFPNCSVNNNHLPSECQKPALKFTQISVQIHLSYFARLNKILIPVQVLQNIVTES